MSEDGKFNYSYSSSRRKEIEEIRNKYLNEEERDIDELRKLDGKVEGLANLAGIGMGLIGTLVLGGGMSLVLSFDNYGLGIPVGVFGIGMMGSAVKVHSVVLKKLHEKYAGRILELSDRLLGKNDVKE